MVSSSVFFSARRDVELFFYRFSLSCLFFAWDAFVSARHNLHFFSLSVFFPCSLFVGVASASVRRDINAPLVPP